MSPICLWGCRQDGAWLHLARGKWSIEPCTWLLGTRSQNLGRWEVYEFGLLGYKTQLYWKICAGVWCKQTRDYGCFFFLVVRLWVFIPTDKYIEKGICRHRKIISSTALLISKKKIIVSLSTIIFLLPKIKVTWVFQQ